MSQFKHLAVSIVVGLSTFLALRCPAADPATLPADARLTHADIVVYEGTPAGVMAAVAAARLGHSVLLVEMNNHVGGVVAGGLVSTDMGDRNTVGGLANEFFERIVRYYTEKYGPASPQLTACERGVKFEPHVAEEIFDRMLGEQPGITVWKRHRYHAVEQAADGKITSLVADDLADGGTRTFTGDLFIDASYEGDLMAGAHVPYVVGREARAQYGEYLAGVGDGPKNVRGTGDHRTMAYNYRVSITSNTDNRVLCPKPEHYDPAPFAKAEGAAIREGRITSFVELYAGRERSAGPNEKYDSNWADFVGNSEGYADGDWVTRERIAARQRDYVLSRLYYFQFDPGLPEPFRLDAQKWGLPKDEFADSDHFPFQLYVREARRMVGRYVLHEDDLTQNRWKQDGIATGSYGVDCHVVQHLLYDGKVVVEHTQHTALNNYDIPYACLTPEEPGNLLVPVCCSASHVAYCSLRMEPVYMMLGHAAGDAAHLALAGKTTVQDVDVRKLRELLGKEGAVLDAGYQVPVTIGFTPAHPRPGETVAFQAVAGPLKDPIAQIAWDFEGNGQVSARGDRAEYVFKLDKVYTVSLVVQDKAGRRRWVSAEVPVGTADARDITMDDFQADAFGRWEGVDPENIPGLDLRSSDIFFGPGVHRDVVRNGKKSAARIRFQPTVRRAGRYQVCLGFRPNKKQATNVPVLIKHAGGNSKVTVDERNEVTPFAMVPMGEYKFEEGDAGFVQITNGNTDGQVVVDCVRWVWVGE
jgi:hypothetical protein